MSVKKMLVMKMSVMKNPLFQVMKMAVMKNPLFQVMKMWVKKMSVKKMSVKKKEVKKNPPVTNCYYPDESHLLCKNNK